MGLYDGTSELSRISQATVLQCHQSRDTQPSTASERKKIVVPFGVHKWYGLLAFTKQAICLSLLQLMSLCSRC